MIQPDIKGSVVRNSNPDGCHQYLGQQWQILNGKPAGKRYNNVLVLGCSSGFGLASRLATLRNGAQTSIGVCFERPASESHSGSAGWHLDQAFHTLAEQQNHRAVTFNADAFLEQTKQQVIEQIKAFGKKFDLVIYSLAAGVKLDDQGNKIRSSILPTTDGLKGLQVDLENDRFFEMELPAANAQQVADTVSIMGGEDWQSWLQALRTADVLSDDCTSYNYSYLGSELNAPVYREGSLGAAKEHMHQTAEQLRSQGFNASVVVCKALVTKASLFIPLMAPYVMALKAELNARNQEENVFDQMARLFAGGAEQEGDLLRLDNLELAADVQAGIKARIEQMSAEQFDSIDYAGVKQELLAMHGFGLEG
ncbi:hypothetical protein [Reinekea marinisedimentorum]|uniref:trans-2-enoyl-CoA reductase (NAD(+)) n=1 Tax=Reinekea marinisedimentorum TaxID=230495 RepID=A0A4R3I5A5_9GAMM|nr:hypothetical protein [Reinekea marinisedimentorum]TCS40831.1 enoyl-[acyl-carrier protein] reductase/trans-2-enoyl-CoA reductase (NAD+) [Reinekea marinisedimentorum]